VFRAVLQSVPRSMVRRIYDPRLKLKALARVSECAGLENDAVALARLLSEKAGVPLSDLGITGSLLIGLETDGSDLDMAVIGERSCRMVHRALHGLFEDNSCPDLKRLDSGSVEELYAQRTADTAMDFRDFVKLEARKVNQGRFRSRTYFIRFVKAPAEAGYVYGRLRYTPLGRVKIEGMIAEDREAIFTPCRYLLSEVRFLEGAPAAGLDAIVSFRGRFCEQARPGERVIAAGTVEEERDADGRIRHRLLLGNSGEDTMVPLE
jgi:predicted nucleotidyltransferase